MKHNFSTKLICVLLFSFGTQIILSQNQYINLQTLTNPIGKSGWNLVFQDEFTGSKNPMWKNRYTWGNGPASSSYYNRSENCVLTPSTLKIITKKEDFTASGNYVLKHYTSSIINSDPSTWDTLPQTGRTWKYGYFEIRCKNPKGQLLWPAFWLFGEPNSKSKWNELDVFEFGTGDGLVMTNHFQTTSNYNTHQVKAKWIYAIPGQTFGNTWVTYALKWEPNKLVWYINNIPVRVETDKTSIIPRVAMRVKVNSGMQDLYTPYDLNLPAIFPNEMEIDYVRVYQRSDHSTTTPVFTLNKSQSFNPASPVNIPFSSGLPILLDGSQSYMPNHQYFLSVQRCDNNGNLSGTEAMGWLSTSEVASVNKLDIVSFAKSKGLTLASGNYYRVKLAGNPWVEVSQYIYLNTCSNNIAFKINGQNNSTFPTAITIPYNSEKPRIILDGSSTTSCNGSYFISLQECNSNGGGLGTVISKWLTSTEKEYISYFDIENFAKQNTFTLKNGSYYRVVLASGTSTAKTEKVQIVFINPCNNSILFSINNKNNTFPSPININNGEDIVFDGSSSLFCSPNYFISVQECNSNGLGAGTEIQERRPYVNNDKVNQIYYYDIGKIDIRGFCKKNNFDLGCNKYYRVKLAAGNPWTEVVKTIYIQPCLNVDNTYQINGVDASTYNFGDPNTMWSIYLYAPQSISCVNSYFVSIQKKVNGTLTGTEAMGWLSLEEIFYLKTVGTFDLKAFAQDPNHDGTTSDGITLTNNSTYNVKLVASAGSCNSNTWFENNKTIYFGTGSGKMFMETELEENIQPNALNIEMKIYPNPTKDKFLVSLPLSTNVVTLTLMNIQGEILKNIQSNNELQIIDVNDLSSGIYILQAIFSDKILTQKVQIIK